MHDHRYAPTYLASTQRYRNRPEVLAALRALAELARQTFSNLKQRACEENLL